MKPRQHDPITNTTSLQQGLFMLKALIKDSWFALGNVLLLIGGDDSVEIGVASFKSLTLNQAALPLSGNDFEGGCL
jgi:hypothetical protein